MTANRAQSVVTAPSFIVFSDDWGGHPSSCQHLFRRIAESHQVLWVNTIGMRRPTLRWSDVRKAWLKVSRMLLRSKRDPPAACAELRLRVAQPWMIPFNSNAMVRKLNRYSVTRTVRRCADDWGLRDPVLVTTVPNSADYTGHLGEGTVVYYCVDDFSQWPGLEHDLVREMEKDLISKSDVMVATSQKLYRKLSSAGKPTHLLTHGVDIALFSRPASVVHECLDRIPSPRIGYFGLIDQRSDQKLIAALATEMKDFSFVLTGPVVTDVAALTGHANIYFTGAVPYAELPELVGGIDVLFIPYLVNDFTDSISPLKLKEYLVTGRPVVTTPMAEAVLQQEHVAIAASIVEWKAAIKVALTADVSARRRFFVEAMASESWESKAELFVGLCASGTAIPRGTALPL